MILEIKKRRGMPLNEAVRNILVLLLVAFAFFSGGISIHAESSGYSDDLWYNGSYDSTLGDMAGRRLYVYGLVDAQNDTGEPLKDNQISLASDRPINRLEAAEMLYRLCGTAGGGTDCPFTDVPEEYAEAVTWMYVSGVTRGIGNGLYGTGDVTRVQFLTMLSRLFTWDSDGPDAQWGELGFEDQMTVLARENNLLPVGMNSDSFTHGDVYLIMLSLAEQRFPETMRPVREEMSKPRQVTLSAASFLDAEEQIALAIQYAPTRICVNFSMDCPAVDLRAFREKYNADDPNRKGEYPFTTIINTAYGSGTCTFTKKGLLCYELYFSGYAPAYLADVDAADWLRCYADQAYSQRLAEFRDKEIQPLIARSMDDYAKASAAQDLVCRVASYDWREYDAIKQEGYGIHSQTHAITGFLDGGVIVCDGYAKTYQWICRCLGLDCFVVYGMGNGDNHAWNKVKVDGVWYNADVCWKDTGSGNNYFLRSDAWYGRNLHSFHHAYVTSVFASSRNYQAW